MTAGLAELFDPGSSESETETLDLSEADKELKPTLIRKKCDEFERVGLENIRVTHHLKMAKEAIKAEKPPKGLTPALALTAFLETEELRTSLSKLKWSEAGLQVCRLLKNHYSAIYHTNMAIIEATEHEIRELPETAEDPYHKAALKQWVSKTMDEITAKFQAEKKKLAERANKKDLGRMPLVTPPWLLRSQKTMHSCNSTAHKIGTLP